MKIKLFVILTFLFFLSPTLAWGEEITFNLSANKLEVGLDPAGDIVSISGVAPENSPVIIKVEGSVVSEQVSFGKNNSWFIKYAENEVHGLPGYYQILTSEPLDTIKNSHPNLGINPNYDQLRSNAWVRVRQIDHNNPTLKLEPDCIRQAIGQKVSKNLYGIREGVVLRQGKGFHANIPLVTNMPLGDIKLTAMTIQGGKIYTSQVKSLKIESASILSAGSNQLSINPVVVITAFMIPILMLTAGQILEMLEERRRLRQLRSIWR